MKLLYVVQAYGRELFGGAETHCAMMATRMAGRGHEVHVATSCAKSYVHWTNEYEPGTSELDGVTVHRFEVDALRDDRRFGRLSGRVLTGHRPIPLFVQERWIDTAGPRVMELPQWLWDNATDYDCVIFFTYLYFHTIRGLPMASGRVPTVLHPLSHDERPLYLPLYDTVFKLPSGLAFSVEEDAELAHRRFRTTAAEQIVGIGTDLNSFGDGARFRDAYGLGDLPYVVSVGRLDSAKGSDDLYDLFVTYKQRNPGPLKLVLVGQPVQPLQTHPDIVVTGFVDEQTRNDAVAGALVSVHPSYFESFSMVLTEAWAQRKPAIVNGRCEVFAGQARRSGGALAYTDFGTFEAALDMVAGEPATAARLAAGGRAYVERRYDWNVVMDTYERFIERVPVH